MRSFLVSLTRNPISLLGAAVTTASGVLIVTLFAVELFGFLGNPYIGILAYLVLPALIAQLVLVERGVRKGSRLAALALVLFVTTIGLTQTIGSIVALAVRAS